MVRIGLIILLSLVLLLAWLGFQLKNKHRNLAIACFTSSGCIALIVLGGTMGWIGG